MEVEMEQESTGVALIDAIRSHRLMLNGWASDMENLAWALSLTGNKDLADSITHWIEPLTHSAKEIVARFDADQMSHLRHGEAMMGNLLKATLAGCLRPAETA